MSRRRERRYAKRHGYFWLPCHLCGEYFGGHEAHGTLHLTASRGQSICPPCTAERQEAAERVLIDLQERAGLSIPMVSLHTSRATHYLGTYCNRGVGCMDTQHYPKD